MRWERFDLGLGLVVGGMEGCRSAFRYASGGAVAVGFSDERRKLRRGGKREGWMEATG